MYLTYKYRLLPTRKQHHALTGMLEAQRALYNAALQERIGCYRTTGKSRSYIDQCKALTEWRRGDPEASAVPANLQRWTLKRLDEAYQAFFRRIKARKGKSGFPRFRGAGRWNAFGFAEFSGIRFDGRRIRFNGLPGGLRIHLHRPLPKDAAIKSCVFRRDHKGWHVCLQIALPEADKRAVSDAVGIDVGLKTFAYLSDGVVIPNPRVARRAEKEMRRKQRALARCKRGSNRRRKVKRDVAKLHARIVNARTTWLHQQSARIARSYDLIVAEDLNVSGMIRHPRLARSIADAAWAKFMNMIDYKAAKAGSHFIKVSPKHTSQRCSGCGELVPKTLAVRVHSCPSCGLAIDRDWNAARNILHAAVVGGGFDNVAGYSERRTGKLTEISK